jgi:DNA polymerase-1
LDRELERRGISQLKAIEFPFISVLIGMEREGVRVDISKLEGLKTILTSKIETLSREIFNLTEREFNINSPKQLGAVLFEDLKLKGGKRTKTGYSTNERVLRGLEDEHEVIPKVLEYRATQKLLSTYVLPLSKLAREDGENRIYTSFLQTGTSTGRLSSKEPNLQNIPVSLQTWEGDKGGFYCQRWV